jgi:glyoxylase-like metal-dependent hydrolase (beta-lactamase superfamily II)
MQKFRLENMLKNIYTFIVNFYETNSYMYKDLESDSVVIIDPGGEIDEIVNVIKKEKLKVEHILITHAHFDHIASLENIYRLFPVPIIVHELEFENVIDNNKNLSLMFGVDGIKDRGKNLFWKKVKDNETFFCGGQKIKVIHTPGHTSGGICFYIEENAGNKILFSGDTLFCGTVGRTDFDGGDYKVLLESLKKLSKLPKETIVFPGHNQPTTIGEELIQNPYLKNV